MEFHQGALYAGPVTETAKYFSEMHSHRVAVADETNIAGIAEGGCWFCVLVTKQNTLDFHCVKTSKLGKLSLRVFRVGDSGVIQNMTGQLQQMW